MPVRQWSEQSRSARLFPPDGARAGAAAAPTPSHRGDIHEQIGGARQEAVGGGRYRALLERNNWESGGGAGGGSRQVAIGGQGVISFRTGAVRDADPRRRAAPGPPGDAWSDERSAPPDARHEAPPARRSALLTTGGGTAGSPPMKQRPAGN